MILAIDIGNSNIVIGGLVDEEIVFQARIRTEDTKTSDQYCMDLKILLPLYGYDVGDIQGAIISSVVPQVLNSFQTAIKKLTGKTSLVVGPGLKTGMNIRVENPNQVGADLVVGNVAAARLYKAPLVVIDMGTATTMSVVDKSGSFIGGSIIPGVKLSLNALTEGTALLPGLQLDQPKNAIGKNTTECMRSGSMMGTACMLDGMIARMEEELGYPVTVVATGGIAKYIIPLCRTPMIYEKDLLLKGLGILYKENKRP